MENLSNQQKVFTNQTISLATFFGGPIAAGILISKNFKTFGNEKAAKNSIFIGIVATIVIFVFLFSLPEDTVDRIPQSLIPFVYTAIIALIVDRMQGDKIKEFLKNNGIKASGWTATAYGLLGLALNFILIIILVFSSPQPGYEKQIKLNDNVILHYSKKIKDNTPDRIGTLITQSGFLEGSEGSDLLLSETSNKYILKFILPDKNLLKDSSVIYDFNGFEKYLNYNLNLKKKIEIRFTDPNIIEDHSLPEIAKSSKMKNVYEPIFYLEVYQVSENHRIFYNSEMPMKDIKILEKAISNLKGYFPTDKVIDIIFLNNQSHYVLKFFVVKDFWNNEGFIVRIKSTAKYIKDMGIEKEIKVVFIDNTDNTEKEVI